jgi:hypothetical protein
MHPKSKKPPEKSRHREISLSKAWANTVCAFDLSKMGNNKNCAGIVTLIAHTTLKFSISAICREAISVLPFDTGNIVQVICLNHPVVDGLCVRLFFSFYKVRCKA